MICHVVSSSELQTEINSNGGFKQKHVESCSSATAKHIVTTTLSMATKLNKVVTYHEGLPLIKWHDPVTWSCKITWKTKTIITPLPQCLWPWNLAGWWLTIRDSYSWSHVTLWSCVLTRSHDKLKPFYLHYNNAYDHQTWLNCDLPWRNSTHKVTIFGYVFIQDLVTS